MITRAAFANRLPLIDLRLLCSDPADYANPVEPSAVEGVKIAGVIAALAGFEIVAYLKLTSSISEAKRAP